MRPTLLPQADRVAGYARQDEPGRAALEIARFAYPDLDSDAYLSRLDVLAGEVQGTTHLSLRRVISIAHGFGGNFDDYENPDNSFLNRVLETRRGIPISLSVLWIEVGRRAGLEMQGVGVPGHFLVYAAGQLVDPFHYGEAIGSDEAASLVSEALGGPPRLDRRWLEPVETVDLIRRMLRNLETIYRRLDDEVSTRWVLACRDALD
ncbi:MAG: transglutaminase-like domain-containing protein [Acidimicrobiia bacterium]|nr:transglutaminase-like domain-containing protein [Acidimicrobiia bacterium]